MMSDLINLVKALLGSKYDVQSLKARVANLLGFSFIAINNKIRPIYCNKSNKIQ